MFGFLALVVPTLAYSAEPRTILSLEKKSMSTFQTILAPLPRTGSPNANPTHYGKVSGGCESDEIPVAGSEIGLSGSICSPRCSASGSCPTDFPAGVQALPYCGLTSGSTKYCLLECLSDASCDTGATCKGASPGRYGICTYDDAPSPGNKTHYSDPFSGGCLADELGPVSITGLSGEVCAPPCNSDGSCPTDMPPGVTSIPQCSLTSSTGGKYCLLGCRDGLSCGSDGKATCKGGSSWQYGTCTYDK